MGVQLEESHLHQIVVEVVLIDHFLDDVRVLEYQLHQSTVAHALGDVFIVSLLGFGRQFAALHDGILVVHVPHVAP